MHARTANKKLNFFSGSNEITMSSNSTPFQPDPADGEEFKYAQLTPSDRAAASYEMLLAEVLSQMREGRIADTKLLWLMEMSGPFGSTCEQIVGAQFFNHISEGKTDDLRTAIITANRYLDQIRELSTAQLSAKFTGALAEGFSEIGRIMQAEVSKAIKTERRSDLLLLILDALELMKSAGAADRFNPGIAFFIGTVALIRRNLVPGMIRSIVRIVRLLGMPDALQRMYFRMSMRDLLNGQTQDPCSEGNVANQIMRDADRQVFLPLLDGQCIGDPILNRLRIGDPPLDEPRIGDPQRPQAELAFDWERPSGMDQCDLVVMAHDRASPISVRCTGMQKRVLHVLGDGKSVAGLCDLLSVTLGDLVDPIMGLIGSGILFKGPDAPRLAMSDTVSINPNWLAWLSQGPPLDDYRAMQPTHPQTLELIIAAEKAAAEKAAAAAAVAAAE